MTASTEDLNNVTVEARIVAAVIDGTVLSGTPTELAGRLGVQVDALIVALGELVMAGWLAVEDYPGGRCALRWNPDGLAHPSKKG